MIQIKFYKLFHSKKILVIKIKAFTFIDIKYLFRITIKITKIIIINYVTSKY